MRNRTTRRLTAGLLVVLLLGRGAEFALLQSGLPEERRWLALLPRDRWGFGQRLIASHSPERRKPNPFRFGFLGVRMK